MLNILTESLIRFRRDDNSIIEASLPELYAALMNDEVASFPALRPHQRHAWHAFLVQLGAIAMHKAGHDNPPDDAATWLNLIRALTPDFLDDEPWHLIVDDITKPAFMQPAASSEDKRADYKSVVATPDELDMLITSKNHDLKASVASSGSIDDWNIRACQPSDVRRLPWSRQLRHFAHERRPRVQTCFQPHTVSASGNPRAT